MWSVALPEDVFDKGGQCISLCVYSDWLSQLEDLQEQLPVFLVLPGPAGVQLEGGALEEGQGLGQGPQLDQVQEVEVPEPLGALACRQVRVEALLELWDVVSPLLVEPVVLRAKRGAIGKEVEMLEGIGTEGYVV